MTWDWARKTCLEKNATLVTISSTSKNNLIGRLIKTNIWIGLNDRVEAGASSSFQVLTRDWSLFFFVAGGGLGLGNFLRHYLFFSPLGCAWLFFVNNSLFKNCFNMKNRTRVVESTWSFFFFSCTILFSAVCAVKKNFFRNYPTRLSKNNGLSLKLNSSGTRPRWPVRGEWGLWWGDTQYIRNLLSVYVVRHKLILL